MVEAMSIPVTKTGKSKLEQVDFNHLGFGKYFSDHMLEADYVDGQWTNVNIRPYESLGFLPALSVLHYSQTIFEGQKAHKDENGNIHIFRPHENWKRMNRSAERLAMPAVPEEIFIDGMKQLVELDKAFIPSGYDESLYIRPFLFATEETLGVKESSSYKFLIITGPAGSYFSAPARIYVEEKYTRAAPGGTGFAKTGGNYAASLLSSAEAKKQGYDQVLWMDALEHKYVQEVGAMNIMFIIGDTLVTPDLTDGTILSGITRLSLLERFRDQGFKVEERKVSIDELIEAYKAGHLKEVFGCGTAATISHVKELKYKDFVMEFDVDSMTISAEMKKYLLDYKEHKHGDPYGWLESV
ncbi:branched-chain amino acid aminotransferase [Niabella drilacis]|uniref:branched-chain-amino-acid transaminase n=1 Tax=Niabella drilacis (strain DSM 25811 / CCM 8410 / CCUG 62505 / LMG 26954 / E90) TaxID=1285928 RepID=A0A1G6I451_NIADE|nr:branched-chain amino acid aminotransferase [Niabella drilacis]SDC01153.1 branched-chain amino acid aminotransferase [Niabella drilacis]